MAITYYGEFLDKKYATREEWEAAWDAYQKEPVICAHCLHPVDFDIDAGTWHHKEAVEWCDRTRREKAIRGVAHETWKAGNK